MGYRKVLLPVSGKYHLKRAMLALEQALQIVDKDGEIYFLHCVENSAASYLSERQAHPLEKRGQDAGIKCLVYFIEGSPAMEIPRFATEKKCDVLVMFSGERNKLGKLIGKLVMGSITERVLHATNIPMLLVRA